MDALKSRRHSEQQKIEKEVFPQCIQAPFKYFNKRKSLNIPLKKSDNKIILFPGENTSVSNQGMDSSKRYVEQWLMQQEKENLTEVRQPFSSLNVNIPRLKNKANRPLKQSNNKPENNATEKLRNRVESRKRQINFKSHCSDTPLTFFEKFNKSERDSKKLKLDFDEGCLNEDNSFRTCIKTIVIEETQSEVCDKDKLAFKAVEEADNREKHSESEVKLQCSEVINYTKDIDIISTPCPTLVKSVDKIQRVPFFKKDIILEKCQHCNECFKQELNNSNDLTITIESKGFITTINLSNGVPNNNTLLEKHSVPIQTDICGLNYRNTSETLPSKHISVLQSNCTSEALVLERNTLCEQFKNQDGLVQEVINDSKENAKNKENIVKDKLVIIEESDSDVENADRSSKHSELMFGVLTEMEMHVYKNRTRNKMRRRTPTSTDSSDKENRDPNRRRLHKYSKKIIKKNKFK